VRGGGRKIRDCSSTDRKEKEKKKGRGSEKEANSIKSPRVTDSEKEKRERGKGGRVGNGVTRKKKEDEAERCHFGSEGRSGGKEIESFLIKWYWEKGSKYAMERRKRCKGTVTQRGEGKGKKERGIDGAFSVRFQEEKRTKKGEERLGKKGKGGDVLFLF